MHIFCPDVDTRRLGRPSREGDIAKQVGYLDIVGCGPRGDETSKDIFKGSTHTEDIHIINTSTEDKALHVGSSWLSEEQWLTAMV